VLVLLAVSNGAQGMISFLLHHQLAHHRATCLLPWMGLLVLVPIVYAAHGSASQVATEDMVVSLCLFGAMALISLRLLVGAAAEAPVDPTLPLAAGLVSE
jgi:hypothetical protein